MPLLKTICVVEICKGGKGDRLYAFLDNPNGNEQAERLFARLVREWAKCRKDEDLDDDDVSRLVATGHYTDGDYSLYIMDSMAALPLEREI